MALKCGAVLGNGVAQLGWGDLGSKPSGVAWDWVRDSERGRKWICSCGFSDSSLNRTIRAVEDENSSKPTNIMHQVVDQMDRNVSKRLHKDLSSLPRPLSIADLTGTPHDCSNVCISYKGVPGAYSEDAALKAYPHCEIFPCNEYGDAFKAVELWLADKSVLPIKNSFSGSIHHNYDLLLRHRLHIVGEVQLDVNLCLLALPGVRADQLKCVLSHPLALAQSDVILSKLGVARENVDDTAYAAQFVASHSLLDAGVVASALAAEIYGLNILSERIQMMCGQAERKKQAQIEQTRAESRIRFCHLHLMYLAGDSSCFFSPSPSPSPFPSGYFLDAKCLLIGARHEHPFFSLISLS